MQQFSSGRLDHMVWNQGKFLLSDRLRGHPADEEKGESKWFLDKGCKTDFCFCGGIDKFMTQERQP
jgi:hypothetical protein